MGDGLSTPSNDQTIEEYVQIIRNYLRDFPQLNRLIRGEETSNRMIAWAVVDALDDINNSPPLISHYQLSTFPYPGLLWRGAVITILESVGLLQTRNQLSYADGGIRVSVSDKTPLIQAWLGIFRGNYEAKKSRWKIAQNIDAALGGTGLHSEYWFISGYYGGSTS